MPGIGRFRNFNDASTPRVKCRHALLNVGEHIANPGVAHPRFPCQRRFIAEQPVAGLLDFLGCVAAQRLEQRRVRFRNAVNQQPFDFAHPDGQRGHLSQFSRTLHKLWPDRYRLWRFLLRNTNQHVAQRRNTLASCGNHIANRRATEVLRQFLIIDGHPCLAGSVRHRQRDDDRHLQFHQLLHKVQALVEVGRVNDGENRVGRLRAGHTSKNHIDGDLFFERVRTKSVCAWQVDKFDGTVLGFEQTHVTFDGYAWVIADALAQPGQSIEKGALAGVWATDNRNAGVGLPASGNVVYGNASFGWLSHRCCVA